MVEIVCVDFNTLSKTGSKVADDDVCRQIHRNFVTGSSMTFKHYC